MRMVKPAISDQYRGNHPMLLEGMQLGVLVRHQDDGGGQCQTWKKSSSVSMRARSTRRSHGFWDGDIDVKLGDHLNVYKAEGQVGTFSEAAEWLRDQAVRHYPSSEFARQFAAR
jgi:hypothetical protein